MQLRQKSPTGYKRTSDMRGSEIVESSMPSYDVCTGNVHCPSSEQLLVCCRAFKLQLPAVIEYEASAYIIPTNLIRLKRRITVAHSDGSVRRIKQNKLVWRR